MEPSPIVLDTEQAIQFEAPFQLLANMEYVFRLLWNTVWLVVTNEQYERHL